MATSRTSARPPARPLSPALDKTFKIGLVLKGLDGILEVAGGILLLFLSPHTECGAAGQVAGGVQDVAGDQVVRVLAEFVGGQRFGAIYLLSHGIAKIVLVTAVLRDKLWAYPWLIALLLAFIAYQLYRITAVHFSAGLTALTVFDAVLVWLTWREYQARRTRRHPVKAPGGAGE